MGVLAYMTTQHEVLEGGLVYIYIDIYVSVCKTTMESLALGRVAWHLCLAEGIAPISESKSPSQTLLYPDLLKPQSPIYILNPFLVVQV